MPAAAQQSYIVNMVYIGKRIVTAPEPRVRLRQLSMSEMKGKPAALRRDYALLKRNRSVEGNEDGFDVRLRGY